MLFIGQRNLCVISHCIYNGHSFPHAYRRYKIPTREERLVGSSQQKSGSRHAQAALTAPSVGQERGGKLALSSLSPFYLIQNLSLRDGTAHFQVVSISEEIVTQCILGKVI